MWQFPSLSYEVLHICLHFLRVQEAAENFKMLSSSSPIFDISKHTTFSQTNTSVKDSLKGQYNEFFYSGFFIKQLLLVPFDTHRKDFKFF